MVFWFRMIVYYLRDSFSRVERSLGFVAVSFLEVVFIVIVVVRLFLFRDIVVVLGGR